MALFDPVEAIFESLGSLVARLLLAVLALVLAFLCYALSVPGFRPEMITLLPLVTIGVFISWASSGFWFFVGLAAGLAFLAMVWKILQTAVPKEVFLGLFLLAAVFFLPMTWGEKFADKDAFGHVCIFTVAYVVVAILPQQIGEWRDARRRMRDAVNGSGEPKEDPDDSAS